MMVDFENYQSNPWGNETVIFSTKVQPIIATNKLSNPYLF